MIKILMIRLQLYLLLSRNR